MQKKMKFICVAQYLCFCVGMVWRVRRPATSLLSGQFVRVETQKNFQIILWMDFWLHFRDTLCRSGKVLILKSLFDGKRSPIDVE